MKQKTLKELKAELDNAIFPSNEDDGIEHVDLNYKEFFNLINKMLSVARSEGYDECAKNEGN